MSWRELGAEHVRVLLALERGLTLRRVANESGLAYTTALRRLREISDAFSFRLVMRFEKLGLAPLAVLSRDRVEKPPPFTTLRILAGGADEVEVVAGLVPVAYEERFVRDAKGELSVKGLELAYWSPSSLAGGGPYNLSSPDLLTLPPKTVIETRAPDAVDLALLSYKLSSPFMRLFNAYLRALAAGGGLPELTRQTIAYHWRRHLLPFVIGVRAFPLDPEEPLQVFYAEGWRSHAVARAARGLPGFLFALIDRGRSLVFAQFDTRQRRAFYSVARSAGVRLPFGELIAEKVDYFRLRLWESAAGKTWLYVSAESRVTRPFFP